MELLTKAAWLAIAAVHITPSLVLFSPTLTQTLYRVSPEGPVGLLLTHRGGLFLGLVAVSLLAALDPGARRAAALAATISLVSYLALYLRAGMPPGALRTVALVDAWALLPLILVIVDAWRR
ncbi:MAG: hypothetical protein NW200_08315 [Hyphomonadaceae bacterium]|nr:hypothetical protein [Hyphomonadaceae bacterium]